MDENMEVQVESDSGQEVEETAVGGDSAGSGGTAPESDEWIVAADGTVLPLKRSTLSVVRKTALWQPHSRGPAFNSLFYKALDRIGRRSDNVRDDMRVLLRHATELGLSRHEARLLYGYEHGIIGKSGRFLKVAGPDFRDVLDEKLIFDGVKQRRQGHRFTKDDWDMIEQEAISRCQTMPDVADLEAESVWVGSRSREWPDFTTAPSRMAVKFWLAMNDPHGADAFERDFFRARYFKGASRAVIADTPDEGDGMIDSELHRKLFGDEGTDDST